MLSFYFNAFVNLFIIIDPIVVIPVFLALTQSETPQQRNQTALKACIISAIVLVSFGFLGKQLLDTMGITDAAFRIAGGLLLMLAAIEMVVAKHTGMTSTTSEEDKEARYKTDVSVFPLAIPLIAGPGAMTLLLLLMQEVEHSFILQTGVIATALVVIVITYVILLAAKQLGKVLGVTGTNVISRVFGIILAALAAQFILTGVREGLKLDQLLSFGAGFGLPSIG
ncbi:MarC family integral membrane protein [Candidatus Bealeia paramacronuclearis]|uniref:UPF0056 membrane protein n=1 Tax=Candidatus Bealeia paramacronuclearis TaxID=1921001 RepID=A0ABZ2C2S1_9PROT|nr:MarC family integral membrane protein [Candidatus Bealeia paramacronuclearis]